MAEFLPLCDVLFNVISLAGYFCDVVFDVVFCYALLERGRTTYFAVVIILVIFSLLISQIVSVRWYLNKLTTPGSASPTQTLEEGDNKEHKNQMNNKSSSSTNKTKSKCIRYCVIGLHVGQMGVLWRYAKLFVPVDLRHVKNEVRDLCMLRLVHAFCEAAPMLLLQLHVYATMQNEDYLIVSQEVKLKSLGNHIPTPVVHQPTITQLQQIKTFRELNIVSAVLSLFSVCWALASFSKNVRLQNVHRLVLTWLGVIFQFLWRLGTVISRIISLTVYASVYGYWIFLVIVLHWISMFLWLISPKNVFHGERISRLRKASLAWLIAFVYVFAYINLQEVNHRQKMITFYVVMFMENCLLVGLWMVGIWMDKPEGWYIVPIMVFCSFFIGLAFMLLYYRYFHVRRLRYEAGGRFQGDSLEKSRDCNEYGNTILNLDSQCINDCSKYSTHAIPGVFNCRFSNPVVNAATKRKKKKPTTFVPPPTLALPSQHDPDQDSSTTGHMSIPFWRRPLPRSHTGGSSENEGSAGSRVNIHQKLQEKKQKQLAELKIIEEEIKQGKLGGPVANSLEPGDDMRGSLPRQPIPRVKKHINVNPIEWRPGSPDSRLDSKIFNDLNILSSPNIDQVNNLNKYSTNYDPLYNSFGMSGINIPAVSKDIYNDTGQHSTQVPSKDSNTLKMQMMSRSKLPFMMMRNPFTEQYGGNYSNIYPEATNVRPPSISPRNTTNSPSRTAQFDHHSGLYIEVNHPRQISGTYSTCVDNAAMENIPFPYNVVPPPKSKLDMRHTPVTPVSMKPSIVQHRFTQRQIHRAKTPEILLAPHYLDNSRVYYDWVAREPSTRNYNDIQQPISSGDENLEDRNGENGYSRNRAPSDIDSQVSLPRSYTLPREFKYYRRNKGRKPIKNEHFITSTNSSDGDVDSGDDNESERHSNKSNHQTKNNSPQCMLPHLICSNNLHNHMMPSTSALAQKTNNVHSSSSPLSHQNGLVNTQSTSNYYYINKNNKNLNETVGTNVEFSGTDVAASSNATGSNILSRQMRYRAYGNSKNGVRHETKL